VITVIFDIPDDTHCDGCEEIEEDCTCDVACGTCEDSGSVESSCQCDGRRSCPICRGAESAPCPDCDLAQDMDDGAAEDAHDYAQEDRRDDDY
jgi:hypothetical protein